MLWFKQFRYSEEQILLLKCTQKCKAGSAALREVRLKSPETINASGCCVCSLATTELMVSREALATNTGELSLKTTCTETHS